MVGSVCQGEGVGIDDETGRHTPVWAGRLSRKGRGELGAIRGPYQPHKDVTWATMCLILTIVARHARQKAQAEGWASIVGVPTECPQQPCAICLLLANPRGGWIPVGKGDAALPVGVLGQGAAGRGCSHFSQVVRAIGGPDPMEGMLFARIPFGLGDDAI